MKQIPELFIFSIVAKIWSETDDRQERWPSGYPSAQVPITESPNTHTLKKRALTWLTVSGDSLHGQ